MIGRKQQQQAAVHLAALLIYALLAVLLTWPLLPALASHLPALPGEQGADVWQNVWNLWWVRQSVLIEPTNPYTTDVLFYPLGASLYLHTLNLPQGLLAMPLLSLFGPLPAYNLLTLLMLTLAGYGGFLLARRVAGDGLAALVAGAVVLCSPLRLDELRFAQLPTISDYGLLLALLALLHTLQRRTWRAAALTGAAVLLAGLSSWYHLFHLGLLFLLVFAWRALAAWRSGGRPALRHEAAPWLQTGLISGLLLLPFFLPVALEAASAGYARKSDELVFSADLLRLLLLPGCASAPGVYGCGFALLPLLLAAGGLWAAPRQSAIWAALACGFVLLSLGPRLLMGGVDTGIPLPYALFRLLPVADALRGPVRLNFITTILLALVAACGLAAGFARLRQWHACLPALAAGGLLLLLVLEVLRLPFPLADAHISPFYRQMAHEPGQWSLLEVPLNQWDRSLSEMYAQTYHGKYILTGHLSRTVPRLPADEAPPVQQIEQANPNSDIVGMSPHERSQLLRALRVRYLVVHRDAAHPERQAQQVAAARIALGELTLVYADEELQAYRLDEVAAWLDGPGQQERIEAPLFVGLDRASDWRPLEISSYGQTRWLPPQGGGLWTYTQQPRRALLELRLYSLPAARPLEVWLNGRYVQTLPIAGRALRHYFSAPLELPAGPSLIELRDPAASFSPQEPGTRQDSRALSFGIQRVRLWAVKD